MNMKSTLLLSAGLLTSLAVVSLTGCNGANSGDTPSEPESLAEPTADLTLVRSTSAANSQGYYDELTRLTIEGSALGSMNSSVTCSLALDYKNSTNNDFVNKETFNSCEDYEFGLVYGPGVYRFKLTATDANGLIAEDQLFAIAVESSSSPYLEPDPLALVEIVGASTTPDSNGYYFDDTTLTVNNEASGSLGSDVTCSIEFAHNTGTSSVFEVLQTTPGCGFKTFNLYNGTGTYRVKLTATDGNEEVAEDQKYVIAIPTELADSVYLVADFDVTVSTDQGSLFDVELNAEKSKEGEGGDIEDDGFQWEVFLKEDDDLTDISVEPFVKQGVKTTVNVDRDGIYVARLTLTDKSGKTATTEKMFIVSGTGDALIADFSVSIPSGGAPVNILVDASTSIIDDPRGIDHYEWELTAVGDDSNVNGEVRTVLYQLETESPTTVLPIAYSGNYFIRLTVIDASGNEHEITRVVTVPAT